MKLFKALIAFCLSSIIAFTMISVTAAEEVTTEEAHTVTTTSIDDDGSKAYTLVWKFKRENGHLYKRRWNETLGTWYDPAWILVN